MFFSLHLSRTVCRYNVSQYIEIPNSKDDAMLSKTKKKLNKSEQEKRVDGKKSTQTKLDHVAQQYFRLFQRLSSCMWNSLLSIQHAKCEYQTFLYLKLFFFLSYTIPHICRNPNTNILDKCKDNVSPESMVSNHASGACLSRPPLLKTYTFIKKIIFFLDIFLFIEIIMIIIVFTSNPLLVFIHRFDIQ